MPRLLLLLFVILLHVYVLVDALTTPRLNNPGRLPKLLWAFLSFLPVIGPLTWLILKWMLWMEKRGAQQRHFKRQKITRGLTDFFFSRTATRQNAPDDDEEFLWSLEAKARRKKREAEKQKSKNNDTESADIINAKTDKASDQTDNSQPKNTETEASNSADETDLPPSTES